MLTEEALKGIFGTADLYVILGVEKSASASLLKRAYHKKSLELHPDRQAEEKDSFTEKFQYLHQVYSLLSDKERRAEYDENGTLEQEEDGLLGKERSAEEWSELWRSLFKTVTKGDVVKFEEEYKGSVEERTDVKRFYTDFKGDMDRIMDSIMMVRFDEEDRIRGIIDKLIQDKEVKRYKAYTAEDPKKRKKRERAGKKEAKEVEEAEQEQSRNMDSLAAAIATRQQERGKKMQSLFDSLEEKYCQPIKKRRKK